MKRRTAIVLPSLVLLWLTAPAMTASSETSAPRSATPARRIPQPEPERLRLVIAHHMNAALPIQAGGQNAHGIGSNTPDLPWAGPDTNWSDIGGRTRDMSLTALYGIDGQSIQQQAAWEIGVAQRAGVDAFAFYGVLPTGEARVLAYMQAAQGTGFKISFCSGGGERDEAAIAALQRLVEADRELDVLLRVDGELLLLSYGGNWGDTVADMIAKRHDLERRVATPLLVTYAPGELTCAGHIRPEQREEIYAAERERLGALLEGGFNGLSPFMIASGARPEADLRFYAEVCREHGKLYFPPVSFQFHSPRYMTHAPVADAIWRRSWRIARDGADGVQLVTWNDWGETTALAPGVGSNYGLYDMLREATAAFREDALFTCHPERSRGISVFNNARDSSTPLRSARNDNEDRAWVLYYRYPSTAEPQLYQPPSPRAFRGPEHDHIWVRTALTAPATVVCEGRGEREAPAGEGLVSFPLTPGPVRISVRREGREVLTLSPPESFTGRPWRPDHSLVAFASDETERAYRVEDFPGQAPRTYSEYGDDDNDGLLNWFEGLYFSTLERPATPVGPTDTFNGVPCMTAQREFRDPIQPIREDPIGGPVAIDLARYERELASALWRERYRWGEAGVRRESDGLAIFNPGDRGAREMFAFYDTVPNATYGPLCRWGDAAVKADIRFDFGDRPPSAWGKPAFALTTRVAPARRAMYFLRVEGPSRDADPATATVSLGWWNREQWKEPQERVFVEQAIPLAEDGGFHLSLAAETSRPNGTVRLTGVVSWPDGSHRQVLTVERSMKTDGTAPLGEVGFSAYLHELPDTAMKANHLLLRSLCIEAIKTKEGP